MLTNKSFLPIKINCLTFQIKYLKKYSNHILTHQYAKQIFKLKNPKQLFTIFLIIQSIEFN